MGSIVPTSSQEKGRNEPHLLVFDVKLQGVDTPVKVLIDSGASENFARSGLISRNAKLNASKRHSDRRVAVRLADGSIRRTQECLLDLRIKFLDFDCMTQFLVLDMDSQYDLVLGMKWLARHQPWIDWRNGTMGSSSPSPHGDTRETTAYVAVAATATNEPVESRRALCTNDTSNDAVDPRRHAAPKNGPGVEDSSPRRAVKFQETAIAVSPDGQEEIVDVPMFPAHDRPKLGYCIRAAEFGAAAPCSDPPTTGEDVLEAHVGMEPPPTGEEITNLPEISFETFLDGLKADEIIEIAVPTAYDYEFNASSNADEDVLDTARQKRFKEQGWESLKDHPVYPLVREFADIFPSETPAGLPQPRDVLHEIDLEPGTKYCVTRQWPLPQDQVDYIDEFFAKKFAAGLVRESKSPHTSPTFCVRKATGGWRVVHAFNKLNAHTIPAQTPIPRKDVLLHSMAGSQMFSTIDLMDGFYQILMRESDVPLTAVSTPSGMLWEWLVMPQGLQNAPATFNRLVQNVMRPHRAFAPSYFDDIFIHSRPQPGRTLIETHLAHLRAVFTTMREHKLYGNLKKCIFAAPEIPVLGCYVGVNGVRADPEKIRAVADWPVPKDVKDLRKWLGLSQYLHKYTEDYAKLAKPLTDLLRKDAEWSWPPERQAAFDAIKQSLISAPILALPDHTRPFSIECDASDFAVGCALMQVDEHDSTLR